MNTPSSLSGVNTLWDRCDTPINWMTEPSHGTLSFHTNACDHEKDWIQVDCQGAMWFFSVFPTGTTNCTHVTHLDFWFYTNHINVFKNALDCAFELSYTNAWSCGGVRVPATTLKSLTLQKGWNHLTLPLDFSRKTPSVTLVKSDDFAFMRLVLATLPFKWEYENSAW